MTDDLITYDLKFQEEQAAKMTAVLQMSAIETGQAYMMPKQVKEPEFKGFNLKEKKETGNTKSQEKLAIKERVGAHIAESKAAREASKFSEYVKLEKAIPQGASKAGSFDGPKLSFNENQFGRKIGKHASDFGLNPSVPSSRQFIRDKIVSIVETPDEVRRNLWMGQGNLGITGAEGYVNMYIQGNSAVITKLNGEFITVLKDYSTNSRVVEAASIWP